MVAQASTSRPISRSAMASTDAGQLRRLAEDDITDCVALSAEAGWNQTIEDWLLFLRHGILLGLPDREGVTVGTGAVLAYPGGFAWISMVLVTAARRRERIGTTILEACRAEIAGRGLVSRRLTPPQPASAFTARLGSRRCSICRVGKASLRFAS